MSSTVKRLEAKRLIRFVADAYDRRIKRVRVTAAGKIARRRAVRALEPHWQTVAEEAPATLRNTDWPAFLETLSLFREYMEQRRG